MVNKKQDNFRKSVLAKGKKAEHGCGKLGSQESAL